MTQETNDVAPIMLTDCYTLTGEQHARIVEGGRAELRVEVGRLREENAAQSARIAELEGENARLSDVLDTERYKVAIGVQGISKAVQGRQWLSQPGRGSYAWDDEEYQKEFGQALDEITAALAPLMSISQDWSDCPRDPLRVEANRQAARASLTKDSTSG